MIDLFRESIVPSSLFADVDKEPQVSDHHTVEAPWRPQPTQYHIGSNMMDTGTLRKHAYVSIHTYVQVYILCISISAYTINKLVSD